MEAMPDKEQKIVFVRLREFEAAISKTLAAIKRLAEHGVCIDPDRDNGRVVRRRG